ncbi:MAG: hypothetical protein ACRDPQ_22230 [Nocardioidaceae bacterium]
MDLTRLPENAVQRAADDARVSASEAGQLTCELVGEPQVFETFDDSSLVCASRSACSPVMVSGSIARVITTSPTAWR